MNASQPWNQVIEIGGKRWRFPSAETLRDGNRVWTVSVALAHTVAALPFVGRAVELGAGLGLVGMVAGGVLLERDQETIPLTLRSLLLNESRCEFRGLDWNTVTEPFDTILGSEILYPNYDPASIWAFVQRNWTGLGPVIFANSRWDHLDQVAFPVQHALREFEGMYYAEWRCAQ